MILIVGANVFFSALISKGKTLRVLAINSVTETFELLAPGFLLNKIEEDRE
jgi:predicted nucleic acid-binding protein